MVRLPGGRVEHVGVLSRTPSAPGFILLHAEQGEGVPPGIACADLKPLADIGGISPAVLLLAAVTSILGAATGLFILQRRIRAEN